MLNALSAGFVIFLLVIAAAAALPTDSSVFLGLDGLGHALIDMGQSFFEILQLPVTVPSYWFGHAHDFATVQRAALHDRSLWIIALCIWGSLLLITTKPGRSAT